MPIIDAELLATVTGGARPSGPKPPTPAGYAATKQPSLGNVDVFHMSVQKGKHAVPTTPLG